MEILSVCFLGMLLLGAVGRSDAQACVTLTQALATDVRLSGLKELVKLAGLDDTFDNPDLNVTVFAPNNEAIEEFARMLTDSGLTLDNVTSPSNNVAASIIYYHVVPTPARAANLTDGQVLRTLLTGYNLTVEKDGTEVTIETPENDAKVVIPDQIVCNSYVHIIDDVLLPAKLASIPPQAVAPAPSNGSSPTPPGSPSPPGTTPPTTPVPPSAATTVRSRSMFRGAAVGAAIAAVFAAL